MSTRTLPPGTDVLEARKAEMDAHQHRWMTCTPGPLYAVVRALLQCLLAAREGLSALDGQPAPDPDPLATVAARFGPEEGQLPLGGHLAWPAMEALAVAWPAVEARLAAREGLPPRVEGPDLDVWQQMSREMAVNEGRLPRDEARYIDVVKRLVVLVLDLEARLERLPSPGPEKASKP